jgi:uncharacterized metal-binding protein YceD (DUF177 family)
MKFTLAQLRNKKFPITCEEELDLKEDLLGFEDVLDASTCKIKTTIHERGEETYLCKFDINIDLTLKDSISLKEVPYKIETTAEEIFSTDDSIEDAIMIDGITLDTKEAILTAVLIAKPMSYSEETFEDEIEEDEVEEEKINPAFASLKDLL